MRLKTLVFGALVLATVLLPALTAPVRSADVNIDLFGSSSGWGFTSSSITSPGPTINVNVGDRVTLTLVSQDTDDHNWFVDYDGDQSPDANEHLSNLFPPTQTHIFTVPNNVGGFTYWCGRHLGNMQGPFVIGPAPPRSPNGTILSPSGAESWTGGTPHDIVWHMEDDQPVTTLNAFLNYSYNAGTVNGTIAGPILGSANPHTFSWNVPTLNATDVLVNLTIVDGDGMRGYAETLIPTVDTTSPTVIGVIPPHLATDIPINTTISLTFDEGMDMASTEGAVTLQDLPTFALVPLTVQGWVGDTLTLAPTAALQPLTTYLVNVSFAALDASDPGNPAAFFSSRFNTSSTPPQGTVDAPASGEIWTGGSNHSIQWTASDAEDLPAQLNVSLFYSITGTAPWTSIVSNVPGSPSGFVWSVPVVNSTTVRLRMLITDTAAVQTEALSGLFEIDSEAPTVLARTPAPAEPSVNPTTNVTVSFSEAMFNGTATWFGLETGGVWVAGTATWAAGDMALVFDPAAAIAVATEYIVHVNATARDASDPGNALGTAVVWNFTTAAAADTSAPTITHTPPTGALVGDPIPLSMTITDASGLGGANLTYTDVLGLSATVTLLGPGPGFTVALPLQPQAGTIAYTVRARDALGNAASASYTFDVTNPGNLVVLYASVVGWGTNPANLTNPTLEVEPGDSLTLVLVGLDAAPHYWYLDLNGNGNHDAGEPRSADFQGNTTRLTVPVPTAPGDYAYYCGYHANMRGTLRVSGTAPGDGMPGLLVGVIVLLVAFGVILVLLVVVRRRRKPEEPEATDSPTSEPDQH